MTGALKLDHVTAQPMEDPADPLAILRDLPDAIPDRAEGFRGVER
jgi:hypothetical protein